MLPSYTEISEDKETESDPTINVSVPSLVHEESVSDVKINPELTKSQQKDLRPGK